MKCQICKKETTISGIGTHVRKAHDISLKEYYDTYIKKETESRCVDCNSKTKYVNFTTGYKERCTSCAKKEMVRKVKQTKLDRYGSENFSNPDKVKETKKYRYGSSTYNNRDKANDTMYDKYGMHYSKTNENRERVSRQSKEIGFGTEYHKKCTKNIYGVDHYNQLESNRTRLINHGKQYGFGTVNNTKSIIDKYGVDNISKLNSIKIKKEKTRQSTIYARHLTGLFKNYNVTPMFTDEEYVNGYHEYNFKCNTCNTVYSSTILNGGLKRCPSCYGNRSTIENIVVKMLLEIDPNIVISKNSRKILPSKEIDIYLPEYNIAIEVNGLYWHNESHVGKTYHLDKTNLAEELGIHLIHIWEDDINYKYNIIKCRLQSLLNKSVIKIGARNCSIKTIDSSVKKQFLETHHIQGNCNSSIRLGAYYNNELVGVMTFGKSRIFMKQQSKSGTYEMYRFCTSINVVGLASKLLKYFQLNYNPTTVISYADRCWSTKLNNVYQKIGFTLDSETSPNYHYINRDIREHRYKYRKSNQKNVLKVFDETLSEIENMEINGYQRIFGPGSLKYIQTF